MQEATNYYVVRGKQVFVRLKQGDEEPLGKPMRTRSAAWSHARMLAGSDGEVEVICLDEVSCLSAQDVSTSLDKVHNTNQGVCGHSNEFLRQTFVIFCVGDDIAREFAFRSWASSYGFFYKSLVGSYNGVAERSFLMTKYDFDHYRVRALWCSKEDSVLVLGMPTARGKQPAHLEFIDGRPDKDLGMFQSTSRTGAIKNPVGWTYAPDINEYFVCIKE